MQIVQARPRLFTSMICGIATGLIMPSSLRVVSRILIGWDAAIWLYFLLVAIMCATASTASMRRKAALQDDGRFAILILTCLAAIAAFGGIFAQLAIVKDAAGEAKVLHISLAAATVLGNWAFIHVMFALHYAHEHFMQREENGALPSEHRGGLKFPGTETPDYLDFFYFSFVIGVACATADVEIWSRSMRRTALVHCILAFFFNTAVLALTINIAAGLV